MMQRRAFVAGMATMMAGPSVAQTQHLEGLRRIGHLSSAMGSHLFMNIPWTPEGRLAWGEPVSTPGSYARFRAEMDLVLAFSACPQDILPINGLTGRTTEAHFSIE
jgi:uncharacterized protein